MDDIIILTSQVLTRVVHDHNTTIN